MLNFKFMKVKIKIKFFWEFKVFSCQRQNAACTLIVYRTPEDETEYGASFRMELQKSLIIIYTSKPMTVR